MNRRRFFEDFYRTTLAAATAALVYRKSLASNTVNEGATHWIDAATARNWQTRWEENILDESKRNRYCDTEMGEELGWLVSPFLNGFYYGYLATHKTRWIELLIDWADSTVARGVK